MKYYLPRASSPKSIPLPDGRIEAGRVPFHFLAASSVASAILHFAFPNKYPILDTRVLWSLGWEQPKYYTFDFWQKYCNEIKGISEKVGENIRTIDKALWEYSKENQSKEIVSSRVG